MDQLTNVQKKHDYFSFGRYAVGGLGYSITNMIVMSYLTFFCTDIFGISSMTIAGLMLVTNIVAAISDPIMGIIADATKTKRGRYRPYLIFGAPVLGMLVFMLFSSPDLSSNMKIVFIYVAYIAYALAFSLVGVCHKSMVPVLTREPVERTMAVSWESVMIQFGRLFITTFALPIVEIFGGETVGWRKFSALCGIIITIAFWIVAWGTKKYDTVDLTVKKEKILVRKHLDILIKNKPILTLMIAYGTDVLANASYLAVNMYYFKYVLNRVDLVPYTSAVLVVTGVAANLSIPVLTNKFDRKKLYWWGSFLAMGPLAILLVKPVVPVPVLMVLIAVFGFISSLPSSLGWAMLPDCVDYAEYKFGIAANGLVVSTFSVMNKICMAIGGSVASFVLALAGFVPNQQNQTKTVILAIVILRFGMSILGYIASLISMHFYELTDSKTIEIREIIEKRRKNKRNQNMS